MLTRDGPAVLARELRDGVRDGLHLLDPLDGLRVHQRPDVQTARPGVTVEARERPVLLEHLPELGDELGELCRLDGDVLDETDVFLVARPGEEDGQPALAELPDPAPLCAVVCLVCPRGPGGLVTTTRLLPAVGVDPVGEQPAHPLAALAVVLGVELHEQRGPRPLGG